MFAETASWGNYFYGGLRNFIDAESAYVNTRQQSARANLPKLALNVADSVSFAVKGATAATVLWYGAPLSVTALATLSLFPSNTFSYLADKAKTSISRLSNKFSEWGIMGDEEYEENKQLSSTTTSNSYINLVSGLENAQYVVTAGLTLYQNLLPVNWLKIMAVEAVEQPLRWYYGGLPEYYTKHSIGDWFWTLSGVASNVIQSNRVLRNAYYSKQQSLSSNIIGSDLSVNYLPTISWANSRDVIKGANFGDYLSTIDTKHVSPILPFFMTTLLGKSLFKNNFNELGVNFFMLTSLSLLQTVDAGLAIINLQAGIPIKTTLDLTQLAGTHNISSLIIKYPQQLAQSGVMIYPQFIGQYIAGQIVLPYQALATSKKQLELLSLGIQLPNEELKTTFLGNGQLKWQYKINNFTTIYSSPAINDDTIYLRSYDDHYFRAIFSNGALKWEYNTGISSQFSPVIANDGTVVIQSGSDLRGISELSGIYPNGRLKWTIPARNVLFAIANDNTIYSVFIGGGQLRAFYPSGSTKWHYDTGIDIVLTAPVIANDGTIYTGFEVKDSCQTGCPTGRSGLYAFSPNGNLKWSYKTNDSFSALFPAAIAHDGTVYVKDRSGFCYAIYPDGTLKWQYKLNASWNGNNVAIASDDTVYFANGRGLYAFSPNGQLMWEYQTKRLGEYWAEELSPAIASDGTIYFGSADNYLYALYPNGKLKWKFEFNSPENWCGVYSSPVIAKDGTVYVASLCSVLYAINTNVFSNTLVWPQRGQNNLQNGCQPPQPLLQIFDTRYLTIEGTPTISMVLNLNIVEIDNDNQTSSFSLLINSTASSDEPFYNNINTIIGGIAGLTLGAAGGAMLTAYYLNRKKQQSQQQAHPILEEGTEVELSTENESGSAGPSRLLCP